MQQLNEVAGGKFKDEAATRLEPASIVDDVSSVIALILAIGIVGIVVLSFAGAASRIIKRPDESSGEIAVYLALFVTFIGAAYVERLGGHIRVGVFVALLPARIRRIVGVASDATTLIATIGLAYVAAKLVGEAYSNHSESVTSLRAPMFVIYSSLFIGMILLAVQCAATLARRLLRQSQAK